MKLALIGFPKTKMMNYYFLDLFFITQRIIGLFSVVD